MGPGDHPSDEELAARSGRGDRDAFSVLYERHFPALYDFAARIVRDRDAAADVVQTTFTKAWTNLEGAPSVRNVKAWLFAIARNAAIDEVRHRRRELPAQDEDDEGPSVFAHLAAGPRSDPVAVAQDRELVDLVWSSAAALSAQEYSLLDMHVRRDLGADELADALGLTKGAVYTRLSRLRDALEDSVTSTLLMRRGRRDCEDLDRLLVELRATELTREVHTAIRTHLRGCDRCSESKRRLVSPVEILAGLAPIPAAAGLADEIWGRLVSHIDGSAAGRPRRGRGLRRRVEGLARRTKIGAAIGLAAVVAGAAAGVLALGTGTPMVEDPVDVRSTSHEIGVTSTDPVIVTVWSRVPASTGYSVRWSEGAEDLPDAEADLPGAATSAASAELGAGGWYFHLRTRGEDGRWTGTVHLGPFDIVDADESLPPDAPRPELAIEDDVVQEPRSGRATATLRVSLSSPSPEDVSVAYSTSDGTAEGGEDYRPARGRLSLPAGETAGVIEVVVLRDGATEPAETFFVELTDPVNATVGDRRGRASIVARAVPPDVSIGSTSVVEGDEPGASTATLSVSLSSSTTRPVIVRWETRDGAATAGTDYTESSGSLTFDPGETEATVRVSILGDTVEEPDEDLSIVLIDAMGDARLLDDEGTATIRDDDDDDAAGTPVPRIRIADRSVGEGDAGRASAGFAVTLSAPSDEAVSVRYEVAGGTASLGADLQPGSGVVRFSPGDVAEQVTVAVVGDTVDEANERFFVNLSAPGNAELADAQGEGTIRDDDGPPTLSIEDVSVDEGTGANGSATLTVRLSHASSRRITVRSSTAPGSAAAGSDYTAVSGTRSFAPGETTRQLTVPIVGDAVDEPDESFFVDLSDPSAAAIADGRAIVTIRDDDRTPVVSIGDGSADEGTGGTTSITFPLTISNPSASTIRVTYETVPGSAVPPQDFASSSGTVSFPPGATSQSVVVTVESDTIVEPDETFTVVLSNATNGTIGDGTGLGTILDDDGSAPRNRRPRTAGMSAPRPSVRMVLRRTSLPVPTLEGSHERSRGSLHRHHRRR